MREALDLPQKEPKVLNLAENLNDLKSRFIPRGSGKEGSPAYVLIWAFWDSKKRSQLRHTIHYIQNSDTSGHCFKLLTL